MSDDKRRLPTAKPGEVSAEVDAFLSDLQRAPKPPPSGGRGRLIFALDATASREPSWDRACRIQGEMFEATAALGGLDVKLVYYRGFNECQASRWMSNAADLHRVMRSVSCLGGETQIERVFAHALSETKRQRVNALVFVGDAMEEDVDRLCQLAGELGLNGVPIFLFHEGNNPIVARAFQQMARLSRGAYLRFDTGSADRLKDLLGAVAVYAAGGYRALSAYGEKKGGEVLAADRAIAGLMLPLLGGFAILVGLLLLVYLFVNAEPARLARIVKWGGLAVGGAAIIALLVLTEGRIFMFLAPLLAVLPALRRVRSMMSGIHGPSSARDSTVETRFIRMTLDHDTGAMSGTVLEGRFAGMRLEELRPPELLALLRECRAEDEEAARLLEAYLDRVRSNWHDEMAGDEARTGPPPSSPDVTVEEAYAILGLAPGADTAAIKAAHHRLMKQLHPDHGGTDYLAGKINRARDVLLKR